MSGDLPQNGSGPTAPPGLSTDEFDNALDAVAPGAASSRLAVLLFTDVVGSTELKSRLGTLAYTGLLSRHNELFENLIGEFRNAQILKHTGDGYFAAFSTASDAVKYALLFQHAMRAQDWNGPPLTSRVGIHVGEVAVVQMGGKGDMVGLPADLAARVMSLAVGGQILMTRAAFDDARQFVDLHPLPVRGESEGEDRDLNDQPVPSLKWLAHGRYQFKGSDHPIEIFEVGAEGLAPLCPPQGGEKARRLLTAEEPRTLGWRPALRQPIPDRPGWTLQRRIGTASFGEVWLAQKAQSGEKRVFKFCFDPERLDSFSSVATILRLGTQPPDQEHQAADAPVFRENDYRDDASALANLPGSALERLTGAIEAPEHPRQIGPYHILEFIDGGGMGDVYKAERRSPMRQLVAIKIIKLGFDTREVIARFESERQALARMDHPHVAKVLDAGTTDSGRPFFVMEYVAGVPITKFADDNKLTIKDRLLLFTQVCEAIAHAHTKAIIHRDIKASNVLAYLHDGKPTVKVIDFGIAKALTGDRLTERTFNTDRGHVVGTWETMSPEQAEGSPDIDTRTDVYSLGVLLYELLTGAKPFDQATLARAAEEEIRRIIREVDPPRPSTRLSSLGAGATKVASLRRQQLDALARELRSELEWIPLKAMRKERDRRYVSAHQISEDIQNYLEHHPLIAGPESRVYRLRKFFKRNKVPVAAVTAVVLVLTLGVLVSAAFYVRAERHRLDEIRTLTELVGTWNEQAIQNMNSGDLPEAESRLREGVDRSRRKLGPNDPTSLALLNNLALVLKKQGRLEDAEPMYRDVLERRRRVLGGDALETIYSLNNLGGLLLERAARDRDPRWVSDAEPVLRDAYARSGLLEDSNPLRATVINNYATLLRIRGKRKEAEPLFQQVLDLRRRFLPANHPNTLDSLYVLATLLQQLDRNADAEPLLGELYQKVPTSQIAPATANIYISRWGTCLVQLGRYSEAEEPLMEAYKRLNAGQRESIAIREVVGAMVEMYEKTGRTDEAARWRAELAALQATTRPGAAGAAPSTSPAPRQD